MRRASSLLLVAWLAACRGRTTESSGGGAAPFTGGETRWFVVRKFQLGLTTRAGRSDVAAWRDYGFDLDARNTSREDSKSSVNSCKRVGGSGTTALGDGRDGLDNNFGQHMMLVLTSLDSEVENRLNDRISAGGPTLLLRLDNVGPDDNANVPGALYASTGLSSGMPTFTASDVWTIDGSSLTADQPKLAFPRGYMRGGYWISGHLGTTTGPLPIPLTGTMVNVTGPIAESILISFRVVDGADGTLAAAMKRVTLLEMFLPVTIGPDHACPGTALYDQVVNTILVSADLVSGAPLLQDSTRECDAISIGMGFVPVPTGAPTAVVTLPPPAKPCP